MGQRSHDTSNHTTTTTWLSDTLLLLSFCRIYIQADGNYEVDMASLDWYCSGRRADYCS